MAKPEFHILIVEDNENDAQALMDLLAAMPTATFQIEWAQNMAQACEVLGRDGECIDLIFCDYILGPESGLDFLNSLRAMPDAPPTVMITAMDDREVDLACMEAGAKEYLRKGSLTPDLLDRVIRYTIFNHRTQVELKSALKVREQMLSIVSHDVAGPLSTLHATLKFLVERFDTEDPNKIRLFLERARASASGILELTTKLLDWAKAQTHHFIYNPEPIILAETIDQERSTLESLLEGKGLTLEVNVAPNHVAYADRDSVEAVVRNLLTNAIKFSQKGDRIEVKSQSRAGRVAFKVIDQGVGMRPELRDSLFNEEKKTAQPGTMNERGHGLGLMLCKAILERNRGSIWVDSEPGQGSTFTVTLPADRQGT